jgi:CBS domain-containing protein
MPLAEWADRLRFWIMETDRASTFYSGIIFDYRQIAGSLQVAPTLDQVASRAQGNAGFIRRATALALRHPRPLGFLSRFKVGTAGGGKRGLDIKQSGLFPIVEVARALALESSLGPPSTLDRLRRVAARPEWSEPATALIQVFKSLQQFRLQSHMNALEEGLTVSDVLEPKALDRLTRLHIKDDFRVLYTVLDEIAFRFGLHR